MKSRNISNYADALNTFNLNNQSSMTIVNGSNSSMDEYEDDSDNNPFTLAVNKKKKRKYSPDAARKVKHTLRL